MLGRMAIRAGAAVAFVLLYVVCPRRVLGPDAEFWDRIRYRGVTWASRLFGRVLHTDRPIRETEFAGTLDMSVEEAERLLWARGFHRNPVAAVKTRAGVPEVGSWVRRRRPTARRQLHVMLFERRGAESGVDVYAHEEFSNVHPLVAVRHYRGIDQQERLGVEMARAVLPLD